MAEEGVGKMRCEKCKCIAGDTATSMCVCYKAGREDALGKSYLGDRLELMNKLDEARCLLRQAHANLDLNSSMRNTLARYWKKVRKQELVK